MCQISLERGNSLCQYLFRSLLGRFTITYSTGSLCGMWRKIPTKHRAAGRYCTSEHPPIHPSVCLSVCSSTKGKENYWTITGPRRLCVCLYNQGYASNFADAVDLLLIILYFSWVYSEHKIQHLKHPMRKREQSLHHLIPSWHGAGCPPVVVIVGDRAVRTVLLL